jgi:hypothetical protein
MSAVETQPPLAEQPPTSGKLSDGLPHLGRGALDPHAQPAGLSEHLRALDAARTHEVREIERGPRGLPLEHQGRGVGLELCAVRVDVRELEHAALEVCAVREPRAALIGLTAEQPHHAHQRQPPHGRRPK